VDTATKKAIEALLLQVKAVAETAEKDNDRDLTAEERTKVTGLMEEATRLKNRAKDKESLAQQLTDLSDGIGYEPSDPGTKTPPADFTATKRGTTVGQSFVDSPEYKAMLAGVPGGRFGEKARVQSAPYGVKDLLTGADHDTSAGSLLVPQHLGLLEAYYQRPLTLRQLVSGGTTTTDTIDFVRLVSVTNNAAPVPEALTSAAIGSGTSPDVVTDVTGGVKPESAMVFEKDSTTVKTIAHWIPATKRALSDPAQVRTLVDAFLRYGLEEELEDQIAGGDGTGENFLGIANTSGIQTQNAPSGGQDVFDVTRIAKRKVRIGGRSIATAYAMNPVDWEAVELMRNTQGVFYGAGPFANSVPRLWGLPVVESEAIPSGTAYVADWTKAILWDREQASIQVTDSHADFFVRNLVAILAELRAAFAILRPPAFCKITL
jgi:HK97 family phage major capsid protein